MRILYWLLKQHRVDSHARIAVILCLRHQYSGSYVVFRADRGWLMRRREQNELLNIFSGAKHTILQIGLCSSKMISFILFHTLINYVLWITFWHILWFIKTKLVAKEGRGFPRLKTKKKHVSINMSSYI